MFIIYHYTQHYEGKYYKLKLNQLRGLFYYIHYYLFSIFRVTKEMRVQCKYKYIFLDFPDFIGIH